MGTAAGAGDAVAAPTPGDEALQSDREIGVFGANKVGLERERRVDAAAAMPVVRAALSTLRIMRSSRPVLSITAPKPSSPWTNPGNTAIPAMMPANTISAPKLSSPSK